MWIILPLSGNQGRRPLHNLTNSSSRMTFSRCEPRLAVALGSANHLSNPIHKARVGVVNASASTHQQTLHPQQLRSLLLAVSEHDPPGVSHRCRNPPAQWPLSRSLPQVLTAGGPHGHQGGCSAGGPIHYAVFFCTDDGFGIEMAQVLDEAHAVDIVQSLQSGVVARAVPATSLDGKDKQRLLWDWMDALEQSMAREGGPAIPDPLALGCSEHEHLGG